MGIFRRASEHSAEQLRVKCGLTSSSLAPNGHLSVDVAHCAVFYCIDLTEAKIRQINRTLCENQKPDNQ